MEKGSKLATVRASYGGYDERRGEDCEGIVGEDQDIDRADAVGEEGAEGGGILSGGVWRRGVVPDGQRRLGGGAAGGGGRGVLGGGRVAGTREFQSGDTGRRYGADGNDRK